MFNANVLSEFRKVLPIILKLQIPPCPVGAIISSFVLPINVKRRLAGNISALVVKRKNSCIFPDIKLLI